MLEIKLNLCSDYSQAKSFKKAIPSSTMTRSDKNFGKFFIDLGGPMPVP